MSDWNDPELLRREIQRNLRMGDYEEARRCLEAARAHSPGVGAAGWFLRLEEQVEDGEEGVAAPRRRSGGDGEVPGGPGKLLTTVAVLFVAALVTMSVFSASRRRLHVVNGTPDPVTVRVVGRSEQWSVPAGERVSLVLGEGEHRVKVSRGGSDRTHRVVMKTPFWGRLAQRAPLWCLNVEGRGVLMWREAVYSSNPGSPQSEPRPPLLEFGEPLVIFPQVDFPFRELPVQTSVQRNRTQDVTRSQVVFLSGTPRQVVAQLPVDADLDSILRYLELRLRQQPDDADTRGLYLEVGEPSAPERVRAFLAALPE